MWWEPIREGFTLKQLDQQHSSSTHLTSDSVSLVNSRMSAAVPTKIRRSCESSSRVTPPPRGSSHFPRMRRMSRI